MPQCFQLFKKDAPTDAASLNKVDEELCALLNRPVDESKYVVYWFDTIGWSIAVSGLQLGSEALRKKIAEYENDELLKCLTYLEENYSSTAFYATKAKLNSEE